MTEEQLNCFFTAAHAVAKQILNKDEKSMRQVALQMDRLDMDEIKTLFMIFGVEMEIRKNLPALLQGILPKGDA